VLAAQDKIRRRLEASPVDFLSRRSAALLAQTRAGLAAYLGAQARDLALIPNATTGVSIASASIPLQPGDEVLTSDHEYGACDLAWERACRRAGARMVRFHVPLPWRGDGDFLDRLEASLGPRTKVLFLSHITSPTALRFPIAEALRLAKERGIATVIDGAHAPGQIGLDLETLGADFYIGNCHKWLMAPLGSAFMRVAPSFQPGLDPLVTSWGLVAEERAEAGHEAYAGTEPLELRLQWLGTRDISPFLSIPSALDFLECNAPEAEGDRCRGLAARAAREGARALGLEPCVQEGNGLRMALIPLPSCEGQAVKTRLFEDFHIEVPVTRFQDRQYLRVSCHLYNDESDIDALLAALRAIFRT
jgi:isopenicillin-N epimerase